MSQETCVTCRFFKETGDKQGDCRRYPPIPVADSESWRVTEFPDTLKNWWCGEYQPAPNVGTQPRGETVSEPATQPGGKPAPRITSPAPDDTVAAGTTIAVHYTTNAPLLSHNVILMTRPGMEVVSTTASTPNPDGTGSAEVFIPAGTRDYYVVVEVNPALTTEQDRHVVPISAFDCDDPA